MPDLFQPNRKLMGTPFFPTRQDVERHIRFRSLGSELTRRIVNTVPQQAFIDIGEALGIVRNGVLEFGSEHVNNVLADCYIFE